MIPKQLFFIWLGDNKPKYVDFAVNTFKKVNSDFKVDLMEWKINDIENPKDEILKKSVDRAIEKNVTKTKFIQSVAEIYRYRLLEKYGGIYLDCDTFPVRPFDDELLNYTDFDVTLSWGNNQFIKRDVFFIGSSSLEYKKIHPIVH